MRQYVCVRVCRSSCPRVNLQHNLLIWFLCQLQSESTESNHRRDAALDKPNAPSAEPEQRSRGSGSGSAAVAEAAKQWLAIYEKFISSVCALAARAARLASVANGMTYDPNDAPSSHSHFLCLWSEQQQQY